MDITANCTQAVQQHIFTTGPVVAGFHVFSNFMTGSFGVTRGIYFDTVNYPSLSAYDANADGHFKGGHAIVVLGWGVEKGMTIPLTSTVKDVPYWYCRNSWNNKWGTDEGYFKIAMYPYNTVSQFDKLVNFTLPSGSLSKVGGFILFKPTLFKPNTFSQINKSDSLSMERSFYTGDGHTSAPDPSTSSDSSSGIGAIFTNKDNLVYIVVVVLILGGVGYYYRDELQDFFKRRVAAIKKSKKSKKSKK